MVEHKKAIEDYGKREYITLDIGDATIYDFCCHIATFPLDARFCTIGSYIVIVTDQKIAIVRINEEVPFIQILIAIA
jgi:hypothetical protein